MKHSHPRRIFALAMCALAAVAIPAQAAGLFDVGAWITAHPDLAMALAAFGLIGDTAVVTDPAEIKKALDKISDQVKEQGEKALAEATKGVNLGQAAKDKVDELLTKQTELVARLKEVEQQIATGGAGSGGEAQKSLGELLVESDAFKNFTKGGARGSMTFSAGMKAVTATTAAGIMRPTMREGDVVPIPRRRMTVRDLLPTIPVQTSSIDYPRQTTRTNNAAPVAESELKPYSDFAWGLATVAVRTIAHLAKLTRQAMEDSPRLVAEVDSEMRYGLGLVDEAQILFGDGTGQNLLGIVPQATAYAAPITIADATRIDMIRLGMLQASLALFPPDGIVLNPADWTAIELTKTADGGYLFANPQGTVTPRLWGLPVVDTPAMTIDRFLVGNFRIGATVYDRMAVEVLISTENVDDFERNLATMRAEERIALGVKRPGSFIYGDFGAVA